MFGSAHRNWCRRLYRKNKSPPPAWHTRHCAGTFGIAQQNGIVEEHRAQGNPLGRGPGIVCIYKITGVENGGIAQRPGKGGEEPGFLKNGNKQGFLRVKQPAAQRVTVLPDKRQPVEVVERTGLVEVGNGSGKKLV